MTIRLSALGAALLLALAALTSATAADDTPMVAFGRSEMRAAGYTTPVDTVIDPALGPQAFRISSREGRLTVTGGDERGVLYGLLEIAEQVRLHGSDARLDGRSGNPFIENRGLKFNIPLDARCPSYDDTGDAAQRNIENMWDFAFWREFLDTMARHRYNTLTLWSPNPFPVMTRLPDYPDIALDDICVTSAVPGGRVGEWGDAGGVNATVLDNLRIVRRMSIDEKIAFWQRVFRHARDRGIDVYFITWNIYTNGTFGKYGLSDDIDNPANIPFYRQATRVFLETYPELKGLGVTAGERMHVPADRDVHDERERWLWETYGRGILDYLDAHPDRRVNFIHRFWYSNFEKIWKYWSAYPQQLTFSLKYITARLYSSPERSPNVESIAPYLEEHDARSWWNLRNDDIFVYRWGDPDYVRTFLKNLPHHLTAGYHMGSDGYVWGRVFADRSPLMAGKLELEKHWYKFMLWGRLGYDPSLDRSFFEAHLAQRYPGADIAVLYEAWQAASRVIPQINRFMFYTGDRHWAPEACSARESFRFIPDFRVVRPLRGTGILNPREYVQRTRAGTLPEQHISPDTIARNLDTQATAALEGVARLRQGNPSPELELVLDDLAAMAWLGRFYAAKIDTATALEWFDQTGGSDQQHAERALARIDAAVDAWHTYARISERNYRPQMLARVNRLDWSALARHAEHDRAIVRQILDTHGRLPRDSDDAERIRIDYPFQGVRKRIGLQLPAAGPFTMELYEDTSLIGYYRAEARAPIDDQVWEDLERLPPGSYTLNVIQGATNRTFQVNR